VMLLWIPLNERVGFGTISNIVIIATFIQIGTIIFPKQNNRTGWIRLSALHHLWTWARASRWRHDWHSLQNRGPSRPSSHGY
jgi:hypothetical protein